MATLEPNPEAFRGGLDRYLAPPATSASELPPALDALQDDDNPAADNEPSGDQSALNELAAAVRAKEVKKK